MSNTNTIPEYVNDTGMKVIPYILQPMLESTPLALLKKSKFTDDTLNNYLQSIQLKIKLNDS